MFESLVVGPSTGSALDPLVVHAAMIARITTLARVWLVTPDRAPALDPLHALFPGVELAFSSAAGAGALAELAASDPASALLVPKQVAGQAPAGLAMDVGSRVHRPVWMIPALAPPRLTNVLVATDFSPGSDAAYWMATELALRAGALQCRVLHVYCRNFLQSSCASCSTETRSDEAAEAVRFVREHPVPGVTLIPVVRECAIVQEAVESVAEASASDLVVMGRRGSNRLRTALVGSNSAAVLALSARPVLVVPDAA